MSASAGCVTRGVCSASELELRGRGRRSTPRPRPKLPPGPPRASQGPRFSLVFDPAGRLCYYWSMVVSIAFLYNFWVIIYRFAFQEINSEYLKVQINLNTIQTLQSFERSLMPLIMFQTTRYTKT